MMNIYGKLTLVSMMVAGIGSPFIAAEPTAELKPTVEVVKTGLENAGLLKKGIYRVGCSLNTLLGYIGYNLAYFTLYTVPKEYCEFTLRCPYVGIPVGLFFVGFIQYHAKAGMKKVKYVVGGECWDDFWRDESEKAKKKDGK